MIPNISPKEIYIFRFRLVVHGMIQTKFYIKICNGRIPSEKFAYVDLNKHHDSILYTVVFLVSCTCLKCHFYHYIFLKRFVCNLHDFVNGMNVRIPG